MSWRRILPVVGLSLFVVVSLQSWRNSHSVHSRRYFRWSVFLLDSHPLETGTWNVVPRLPKSNWPDSTIRSTAFPAFLAGALIVGALSRLGASEVPTFMVLMPLLIFTWYYAVGSLIDRLASKRRQGARQPDPSAA
jgi:hypothetical protein